MVAQFRSKLVVEDDGGYPYTLVEPLIYDSAVLNRTVIVPAGFKTDLFSIPGIVTNILPKSEKGDPAAVVHDYLYQIDPEGVSRAQSDAVLREAMQVLGVGKSRATFIWLGVRVGGGVPWRHYRAADKQPV